MAEAEFRGYIKDFHLSPAELHRSILDVGTGDGAFITYLRTVVGNTSAYGVEQSERRVPPHTEGIIIADGFRLPFGDGQFEIVLARNYITMFHPQDGGSLIAVGELLRVLADDGYLKFNSSTPEQELAEKERWAELKGNRTSDRWFDKRYIGAQKLSEYLHTLEQTGYSVSHEEFGESRRLIVTVQKSNSTQ